MSARTCPTEDGPLCSFCYAAREADNCRMDLEHAAMAYVAALGSPCAAEFAELESLRRFRDIMVAHRGDDGVSPITVETIDAAIQLSRTPIEPKASGT